MRRRGHLAVIPVFVGGALFLGCTGGNGRWAATPRPGEIKGVAAAEADTRAELVRRDPVAYMHTVLDRCRTLRQYTARMTRYERRGLLQRLYGPEHIQCWFRREPFSLRLKWLDEDVKYGETVYVEGQVGNKVRFVTRWWCPPLKRPPGVNLVDPETPVAWGESNWPLTDFGLERLMVRTLEPLQQPGVEAVITYEGLMQMPGDGRSAHCIRLEYPPSRFDVPTQELYVDVATDLPVGTVLRTASGRLHAAYYYHDINPNVMLTDDDFLLESERAALH